MASAPLDLGPIARKGASEQVVHRLLGLVKAGNLKAGDRLPGERELAESFDVSRPTIREAVKALSVLGVLKTRHGGGIFVSPLEATDLLGPLTFFLSLREVEVDRLYHARRLIEGEIAALAAAIRRDEDCEALRELIRHQEKTVDDPEAYRVVDTDFHRRLAESSGNPFLARSAESLNVLGQEFRKLASETVDLIEGSIRDHKRVVRAVERQEPEKARQAMEGHMMHVLTTTKASIKARDGTG